MLHNSKQSYAREFSTSIAINTHKVLGLYRAVLLGLFVSFLLSLYHKKGIPSPFRETNAFSMLLVLIYLNILVKAGLSQSSGRLAAEILNVVCNRTFADANAVRLHCHNLSDAH